MKSNVPCAVGLCAVLLVAAPSRAFDPWIDPAHYELVLEVDLTRLPARSWRMWLPTPAFSYDQHEFDLEIASPVPYAVTWDDRNNRMIHLSGTGAARAPLVARFDLLREPSDGLPPHEIVRNGPDDPRRPGIGAVAAEPEAKWGARSAMETLRALYDLVVRDAGSGDCVDAPARLVALARRHGLPARLVVGVPVSASLESEPITGARCWAQAHEATRGWIPLDVREAAAQQQPDAYFGRIPSDRIAFGVGGGRVLSPPQSAAPLAVFTSPHLEVEGVPADPPPFVLRARRIPLRTARPTP